MKSKVFSAAACMTSVFSCASQASASAIIPAHPQKTLVFNVDLSSTASSLQEIVLHIKVDHAPQSTVYPVFYNELNGAGGSVMFPLLSPSFFNSSNEATLWYPLPKDQSYSDAIRGIADGVFSIVFTQSSSTSLALISATVNARDQNGISLPAVEFNPGVIPEPSTWAMMLVGFGMVAGTVRYRRRSAKAVFA